MSKIELTSPRASLYPVPVTLITCSREKETNILTISWTGILCSSPPIIYISIRPSRYSYQFVEQMGRFCVNIPSKSLLEEADFCGNNTGASLTKWRECGFTLVELVKGYPNAIKECKHHLFCDVIQKLELGSHTAFIAHVKHEFIEDGIVAQDHVFDYEILQPVAYCRKKYYSLGIELGHYGFTNK
jgi:flavin reductase (DIM6/NTAB) family NADH-FMN oxidoreductase RutF